MGEIVPMGRRRLMKSTPLYRKLIAQLEGRRAELGWTCARVDDAAGLQDGYYAKLGSRLIKSTIQEQR